MHTGLSLAQACSGHAYTAPRPSLLSCHPLTTEHFCDRSTWLWTLLTSENLGSQEWAVQRPFGEWLLQGLRCWMSCLSHYTADLCLWHLYMLLSSPQGARQMTTIHGQTLIWCYIGMVHVLESLPSHVPSDRPYSAVLSGIIIPLQCLTYSVLHILDF